MDLGITGRTALVLGATSGLGWGSAAALAAEGANVVLVGRDGEKARVREQEGDALPGSITSFVADLTVPDEVARIAREAPAFYGGVDILVLNGGGPAPGLATELDGTELTTAVDLLLRPHIALVRALLPAMREQGWGRIIAIGSTAIHQPVLNLTASNLGRSALAAYLKTLATQVAADGVTVNMVLPGRIDTARLTQLDASAATRQGISVDEARAEAQALIPAGRYGTIEEFGAVVAFLAGQSAGYVTGIEARVDGGLVQGR